MSEECEKEANEANVERIVCNSCSIEFENVVQLVQHTQEVHTEEARGVTCGKCQIDFADINGFLEHLRSVHLTENSADENQIQVDLTKSVKCADTLQLQDTGNDNVVQVESITPEQITIVNHNGETIGIAECDEDQMAAITAAHHEAAQTVIPAAATPISAFNLTSEPRKRRLPAKFRDMIVESTPLWKRIATEQSLQQYAADEATKKDELEIDVSGLTGIKLRTKSYHEEDIISYLSRVEEKLDCIIKHFNVPLNTDTTQRVTPYNTYHNKISRKSASRSSSSAHRRSEQDLGYVSCESPQNVPEVTQYIISDDLLNAVYVKSRNRGNFAKHLVFAAFPIEERLGRNCYGRRGGAVSGPKDPLEHAKLEAVREAVFKKFPVSDGEDIDSVWKRECVIAIDTALRSEMRTHVLSAQNTIKQGTSGMLPAAMNIKEEMKENMAMNVTM